MDSPTGIIAAFQRVMACCSGKRKQKRALQISSPTDVRRMDICMPGLSEDCQAFLRAKAVADATCMFTNPPPSPFSSPIPLPLPHQHPRIKRVWEHTRKLSTSLPCRYRSVHGAAGREGGGGGEGGFEAQGIGGVKGGW